MRISRTSTTTVSPHPPTLRPKQTLPGTVFRKENLRSVNRNRMPPRLKILASTTPPRNILAPIAAMNAMIVADKILAAIAVAIAAGDASAGAVDAAVEAARKVAVISLRPSMLLRKETSAGAILAEDTTRVAS